MKRSKINYSATSEKNYLHNLKANYFRKDFYHLSNKKAFCFSFCPNCLIFDWYLRVNCQNIFGTSVIKRFWNSIRKASFGAFWFKIDQLLDSSPSLFWKLPEIQFFVTFDTEYLNFLLVFYKNRVDSRNK